MESPTSVEPQARIDTLVTDAATGSAGRRTEYTGVAWFGGKPQLLSWGVAASGRPARFDAPFFLPDSLPYATSAIASALVACSVAIRSTPGDSHHLLEARAGLVADPRNPAVAWVQLQLVGAAQTPTAVGYRVDVIVSPEAVVATDAAG
jgi:hypothetical protein